MGPKYFLRIGGTVLITIGTLGIVGIFQQISPLGFFHPPYWINFFHLGLGITIFTISFTKWFKIQKYFTLGATIIGLTIGSLGLILGPFIAKKYNIPELSDPSDHIAHLIVGICAFWGWKNRK